MNIGASKSAMRKKKAQVAIDFVKHTQILGIYVLRMRVTFRWLSFNFRSKYLLKVGKDLSVKAS